MKINIKSASMLSVFFILYQSCTHQYPTYDTQETRNYDEEHITFLTQSNNERTPKLDRTEIVRQVSTKKDLAIHPYECDRQFHAAMTEIKRLNFALHHKKMGKDEEYLYLTDQIPVRNFIPAETKKEMEFNYKEGQVNKVCLEQVLRNHPTFKEVAIKGYTLLVTIDDNTYRCPKIIDLLSNLKTYLLLDKACNGDSHSYVTKIPGTEFTGRCDEAGMFKSGFRSIKFYDQCDFITLEKIQFEGK